MNPIKFKDAALYYKQYPHQVEAWELLQEYLEEEDPAFILRFTDVYRKPLKEEHDTSGLLEPEQKILKRIKDLNLNLDTLPSEYINGQNFRVTIIGLEGVNPDFTLNSDQLDKYNDLVLAALNFGNGKVRLTKALVCTMEPGRYYTQNRLNSKGAARVLLDVKHENIWKRGKHKSQSNCLIQIGAPIKVCRDNNADGMRNDGIVQSGYFGINFHHNNSNGKVPSSIGRWSAGCTVVPNKDAHQDFMNKVVRKDALNNYYSYIPLAGDKIFS